MTQGFSMLKCPPFSSYPTGVEVCDAMVHGGPFRFSREPELGYFCTEETVAAFAVLRSRVLKDFPTLKLIIGHGGGYLPYQVGRARAFRLNEQARNADLDSFDVMACSLGYGDESCVRGGGACDAKYPSTGPQGGVRNRGWGYGNE